MALNVCPAAVVEAPMALVWDHLTNPSIYPWMDATVVRSSPEGPATLGQTLWLRSSGLTIKMMVHHVDDQAHRLQLSTLFPLGLTIHNMISVGALDERTCRVQYG